MNLYLQAAIICFIAAVGLFVLAAKLMGVLPF